MAETSTTNRRQLDPSVTVAPVVITKTRDHTGESPMEQVHRGDVPISAFARSASSRSSFDAPVPLPPPRGPVSAAFIDALSGQPTGAVDLRLLRWAGDPADASTDDDLQLSLWLAYEQHYRGLAGVDDRWEWHPELVRARRGWEQHLLDGLRHQTAADTAAGGIGTSPDRATVQVVLNELASADEGPSLSKFLMREATSSQFAEFLIHRSLYHLKEADPHSWAIPRLSGSVKAAMVTIQTDEYGGGATPAMHAQLFRSLLSDWDLHDTYGHYLDRVPGVTLMATNLISMFGLHRRWRGALVGHLAMFEMTSSVPNARYARGHRRLGGGEEAAQFFDEHVVADAVHDQIALHDLAGGLVDHEPQLAGDIVFGARCAAYADAAFARHVFDSWGAGVSSLRPTARAGA
ncbi:MAG TPA: iron-containing redox enzyme family protein [Microlunatus sp.]